MRNKLTLWLVLVIAVGLLLAVANCGSHPSNGVVQARRYVPAHYHDYSTSTCVWAGKSCIWIPVYHHDYIEQAWSLQLANSVHTGWTEVTELAWTQCHTGARYPGCAMEPQ